jgi:uncharacterized protein DUF4251
MKKVKNFVLLFLSFVTITVTAAAQEKKEDKIKRIVGEQNYVFVAQLVNPQNGRSRNLNTLDYTLTVRKDSVISYLPYFGRAYSAPINSSDGGIKFTSTQFDYINSPKGNKWQITIKPKDGTDVQQMYLDIFDNGNATLQVTSNNRQGISFNGYIIEGNPVTKKAF